MSAHLPDFAHIRVLVVGDVMLDRYWHGKASRISPEAPVPVVNVAEHKHTPGGAANVALNVAALGAKATLLGLVGQDEAAAMLGQLLNQAEIDFQFAATKHPTITKLRVLSQHQQLIRLDFEEAYPETCLPELHDLFAEQIKKTDVVVLSDYGKGALSRARDLIAIARQLKVPVLVDPKTSDITHYQGATLVTPNFKEFQEMVGEVKDEETLVSKARELIHKADLQSMLITRGEKGMSLVSKDEAVHLKAQAREVFDVTGAGDTVIATLAASYAGGLDFAKAADMANTAAGIVVAKMGTATVSETELLSALPKDEKHKVYSQVELSKLVAAVQQQGNRVVMTNGCFDVLHAGHVQYLTQAKALGDKLIIAVNDDASVQKLKGSTRPLNSLENRMQVLAGLEAVDWVVPFSEDTPQRLIGEVLPNVLVKGGDYKIEDIAGHKEVLDNGGEVIILPFKPGCSTTGLVEKILQTQEVEEA
jgi:D-beta-D-heptose 7-phosphate kinase/D-beta-D-heptose 1-phosphate adenosyltransferase